MYNFKNKVVLVTGGARGIGLACAVQMFQAGAHAVAIADINEANGVEAEKELIKEFGPEKVLFIKTDVRKKDQFEDAFKNVLKKWKYIDILINNAGIFNDTQYEIEIAVNATSVIHGTLLGLQYMGKDNSGRGGIIVNMSSILGLEGNDLLPVYSGTKHFVIGFSRSMGQAYHYNRTGVKIVCICPGFTVTEMANGILRSDAVYLFPDLELLSDRAKSYLMQPVESVAAGVITSITKGENGSVWVVENNEHYEVILPDRRTLRK